MRDRRRVRLIASGGTIATRQVGTASAPLVPASQLADLARELGIPSDVEVEPHELALRPSWSLTPGDMDEIARAAVEAATETGVSGVVVTHGTTTLEYTAYLTDLRDPADTPIVFTGAMRRADAPDPDGPANLRDGIAVAADPAAAGLGTLVVFAGSVLSAREAWKQHRTRVDAFLGLDGGVGEVAEGGVRIHRRPSRSRTFAGPLEPRVALVKAYPGAGRELIDAAVAADVRGLVVEGLPGLGGVPGRMQEALRAAAHDGCLIVLASRAPLGAVPSDASGGTGEPLADIGLISAGHLTAEKAWILLMVALGETQDAGQVQRIFEKVAGEGAIAGGTDGEGQHG